MLMDRERILAARAAIGDCTPLKQDCGLRCGAACCHSDDDGCGGVALLPGEEELMHADWGHIERDEAMAAPMLICDWPCRREERPYLCRIFPLCPARGRDGRWTVRMDARARPICPLIRSGLRGLDPDFLRGVVRSVRLLCTDSEGEAFLTRWAQIERQFSEPFL